MEASNQFLEENATTYGIEQENEKISDWRNVANHEKYSLLSDDSIELIFGKKDKTRKKLSTIKNIRIIAKQIDMLAYMTLYARIPDNGVTVIEQCDFFVLNGVGEVRVLLPYLKEYDSIHCFLDNDEAGRTATKEITKAYPGISIDESYRYQSYNDLNDFLLEKK